MEDIDSVLCRGENSNTPVMNQEVHCENLIRKDNTECGECKVSKFNLCYIKS